MLFPEQQGFTIVSMFPMCCERWWGRRTGNTSWENIYSHKARKKQKWPLVTSFCNFLCCFFRCHLACVQKATCKHNLMMLLQFLHLLPTFFTSPSPQLHIHQFSTWSHVSLHSFILSFRVTHLLSPTCQCCQAGCFPTTLGSVSFPSHYLYSLPHHKNTF